MRLVRALPATVFTILLIIGTVRVDVGQQKATPNVAVGPQYDSTHVYVTPDDFESLRCELLSNFRRYYNQTGCDKRDTNSKQHPLAVNADAGGNDFRFRLQDTGSIPVWRGANWISGE